MEILGGQFMIIPLYRDECLKQTKTGSDASMARMMGASWLGALIALTELPKHRSHTNNCQLRILSIGQTSHK